MNRRPVWPGQDRHPLLCLLPLLILSCCAPAPPSAEDPADELAAAGEPARPSEPELTSPLSVELYARATSSEEVVAADAALAEAPDDVDLIISAARERRNIWRYNEAIDLYTRAIELAPDDWRPYRFRGHRYISTRRYDEAIVDLQRARELAPDEFDVTYHLGLAYFLAGRFADAAAEYGRCMEAAAPEPGEEARGCASIATNDDTRVAITEWRYRALRRAGEHQAAAELLATIDEDMTVEDNVSYYVSLLHAKGLRARAEILDEVELTDNQFVTIGYGVASWLIAEGRNDEAAALLGRIVEDDHWNGFGYIAAEADLVRLQREGGS